MKKFQMIYLLRRLQRWHWRKRRKPWMRLNLRWKWLRSPLELAWETGPYPPLRCNLSLALLQKKAKGKAPVSSILKAKNGRQFKGKTVIAEKKVSQETLQLYHALNLLNGLGCLEMLVFPKKYNESMVIIFMQISLLTLMILIVLLCAKCMWKAKSLPSPLLTSWFHELHILC